MYPPIGFLSHRTKINQLFSILTEAKYFCYMIIFYL